MKVNIIAFGIAKEIFGTNRFSIEFEGKTSNDLKESLEKQFPKLIEISSYLLAVNREYVLSETNLSSEDEIAIIPPVSGG